MPVHTDLQSETHRPKQHVIDGNFKSLLKQKSVPFEYMFSTFIKNRKIFCYRRRRRKQENNTKPLC